MVNEECTNPYVNNFTGPMWGTTHRILKENKLYAHATAAAKVWRKRCDYFQKTDRLNSSRSTHSGNRPVLNSYRDICSDFLQVHKARNKPCKKEKKPQLTWNVYFTSSAIHYFIPFRVLADNCAQISKKIICDVANHAWRKALDVPILPSQDQWTSHP